MDKMREDFEAWECDADQGPQTDPVWLMYDAKTNTYPLDKIQARWEVWQASRKSLVIELPVICASDCPYDLKRDIAEELEAAGIKVQP